MKYLLKIYYINLALNVEKAGKVGIKNDEKKLLGFLRVLSNI